MPLFDYKTISRKDVFKVVKPVKTVVEIGACQGFDTLRLLNNFRGCTIFSVEPKPVNIAEWKKKHDKNPKAHLFEGVISGIDGTIQLHVSDDKYRGASSIREPTKALLQRYPGLSFGEIVVQSMTLPSFFDFYDIDGVDFMWVDVQGAERDIIDAGYEVLEKKVRYLFIEVGIEEVYAGQSLVDEIVQMLPCFRVVGRFQDNLFFKNKGL